MKKNLVESANRYLGEEEKISTPDDILYKAFHAIMSSLAGVEEQGKRLYEVERLIASVPTDSLDNSDVVEMGGILQRLKTLEPMLDQFVEKVHDLAGELEDLAVSIYEKRQ